MTTEQAIMSAMLRTDMFLVSAWKYALIALTVMGMTWLTAIVVAKRKN